MGRSDQHALVSFFDDAPLGDRAIVGVWYWDVQDNRLYSDGAMAELFGVDPEQAARGVEVEAFIAGIHPEDRERVAAEVQSCLRSATDFRCDYRLNSPDEPQALAAFARCHRMIDGTVSHYVGLAFAATAFSKDDRITPAARMADHVMRAYHIAQSVDDKPLKFALQNVLFELGTRLAIEAR